MVIKLLLCCILFIGKVFLCKVGPNGLVPLKLGDKNSFDDSIFGRLTVEFKST